LHDGKNSALTIRLDRDLQLTWAEFRELRRRIMPFAEARGYLTDEDVFRDVSGHQGLLKTGDLPVTCPTPSLTRQSPTHQGSPQ
jgi:hypothetical protein